MSENNGDTTPQAGIYRHYKGNLYEVTGTATHSETLETYVVYRQLYGEGSQWIRPLDMFCETVSVNGVEMKRFERVS